MKLRRTSRSTTSHGSDRLFAVSLFAVVVLFLLISLLIGSSAYRAVEQVRHDTDETRLGLSLIANSIHMNDAMDAVGVGKGPEGPALVLTERLEAGEFETRFYAYRGFIVEEYARADSSFNPERAREVVASTRFDFTCENDLLTVHTDQGTTSVALRSDQGGA